ETYEVRFVAFVLEQLNGMVLGSDEKLYVSYGGCCTMRFGTVEPLAGTLTDIGSMNTGSTALATSGPTVHSYGRGNDLFSTVDTATGVASAVGAGLGLPSGVDRRAALAEEDADSVFLI